VKQRFILLLFALFSFSLSCLADVTLYDKQGYSQAYIDTSGDDQTIYLLDGTPCAYLVYTNGYYRVYGFNGKHLGWYENGRLFGTDGYLVGFRKGAYARVTSEVGVKYSKKSKPFKRAIRSTSNKVSSRLSFSSTSLRAFLRGGI